MTEERRCTNITITETTYEHVRMMLHELLDEWQILNGKLKATKSLAATKDAEIERLKKEVSHTKEVEFPRRVEKVTKTLAAKLQAAEALSAVRLTDQEAIERHVAKRVAGEIVDIMNHCETFQDVKAVIWQTYGVE